MPAATDRETLLKVTDKEWKKLDTLLAQVPEELAMTPQVEAEPSIRDILTHRSHWIGLFFQWLEEGEAAQLPDHGVKWNQLRAYNAALRARYEDRTWTEAREALTKAHERLREWMVSSDAGTLYGGPMPGGTGWTAGRYAEAAGPSHYRSAAAYIRAVIRNAGP